ncbi:disulfide bond formation protein B [Chitinilyticum litopenaei]|uniref:disulfide bond formation protein B n=1 Tax=Chitinilyticum litopenaei TaxID=1121276 RepID=UPI00040BAD51|nr:disulfide bond formation protein B [Chitinilyticum litopenaei]
MRWRLGFLAVVLFCAAAIGFALYQQYYEFKDPCPLCIFQRIAIIACGLVALLAALLPLPRWGRFWPALLSLVALAGLSISLRQVHLQYFVDASNLPSCGAGLGFLFETQPWLQVFESVLAGHGECAERDEVLGLSLAIWAGLGFVGLAASGWLIRAWQQKAVRA